MTWIGAAVVGEDVASADFEARLLELPERRMPDGGELWPLVA